MLTREQMREPDEEPAYVLDTRGRNVPQAGPLMASSSYQVCRECGPELAREHRCPGCPVTKSQDGKLPPGARLVRY